MPPLDFTSLRRVKRRRELQWLEIRFDAVLATGKTEAETGPSGTAFDASSSVSGNAGTTAAVLIEAPAGVGKSTLVESFLESERVAQEALVWWGKFEEQTAAQPPFAAIIHAMDILIDRILKSGEGATWGRRIRESLDVEIDLLEGVFPSFHGVVKAGRRLSESTASFVSLSSEESSSYYFEGFGSMTDKEWRFERLRLAMRALFRCLSSHKPVVFCLDDLHWVDADSLALIKTLISDRKKGRRFMFIGTTRPHTVPSASFPLEQVEVLALSGLTVQEISPMLENLLQQSTAEVLPLAECLHQHTDGNAIAVLHFLRRLSDENYFLFDETTSRWKYDIQDIRLGINTIEDPTEMIRESLLALGEEERLVLIVAASFGTSYFEITAIVHALHVLKAAKTVPEAAELDQCRPNSSSVDPFVVQRQIRTMEKKLLLLENKGFVVKQEEAEGRYKFAHDSIREAAYSLFPDKRERQALHLGIGRQLRLWMDAESEFGTTLSEGTLILYAAKHLNKAAQLISDSWERMDLAELNYHAAEVCADRSSFFPALEYLRSGVDLLGDDGWKNHYALAYKLHIAVSRIQYSLGLYDECLKTTDTVIANARFVDGERVVYHTRIFCLVQLDRKMEALDLALSVLDRLGHSFPRRFLQMKVASEYKKAAKLLRNKSDDQLLLLPRKSDKSLNEAIEYMERMAELSKFGTEPAYFNLFAFRLIDLTLRQGIFPLSTYAFITWAWCMADIGEHDEAIRFGKLALKLADEGRGASKDTRTKFVYWTHIFHWRQPYREGLAPMMNLLNEFWQFSALDFVMMHAVHVPRLGLASGYNLQSTLVVAEKYSELMLDYKQDVVRRRIAPIHQAILNLMGRSATGSRLIGSAMNEETCRGDWSSDAASLFVVDLMVLFVGCFFHDYHRAVEMTKSLNKGGISKSFGPDYWVPLRHFYSGLALAALATETKHRGHRRKAQSYLLQLRFWSDEGNVACRHMCLLLEAQFLASDSPSRTAQVVSSFEQASEAARDVQMIQHEALACELAARFLHQIGDVDVSAKYFAKAIAVYRVWGAYGKVTQLESNFQSVLSRNGAIGKDAIQP